MAHGSRNEFSLKVNINQGRNGDALCTQCHTEPRDGNLESGTGNREPQARKPASPRLRPGLGAHTFHKPDSAGSRCISCHMSDVNWRLLIRRRDHTFQAPVPENTAQFGIPNACTTCHDNRTPEWAAKQMTAWWGDGERRAQAVSLADTMYRAGSGDTTTLPAWRSWRSIDRRASWFARAPRNYIGRLVAESRSGGATRADSPTQTSFDDGSTNRPPKSLRPNSDRQPRTVERRRRRETPEVTPAIINALIGAADDPEAAVRAKRSGNSATIGDRRALVGADRWRGSATRPASCASGPPK